MGDSSMEEEPIPVFNGNSSSDIPEGEIHADQESSPSSVAPEGRKNVPVSFQIPAFEHELLVSRAMGARMNVSQYLRELIRAEGRKSQPFFPYIPPENLKVYQMIEGIVRWLRHLNDTIRDDLTFSEKGQLWATIELLKDNYQNLRREILGLEPGQPLRESVEGSGQTGEAFFVSEEESWEKTEVDPPVETADGIPSAQNSGE